MNDQTMPDCNSNAVVATIRESNDQELTLTLSKGRFADLLFGFLGQKETLKKTFHCNFAANLNDLLQFHYLLSQKTEKEQFISLSYVTATFQYDDETNRTINTVEALGRFSEHRNVGVLAFAMTWHFVFKAPHDPVVHQQKVSLFLDSTSGENTTGSISVSIDHTNQVWASEVLRLFEDHIQKIKVDHSLLYRVLLKLKQIKAFETILSLCFFALLVGFFYILYEDTNLGSPLKVREEFLFDLADIIAANKDGPNAERLLLHFFLVRDIEQKDRGTIRALHEGGYFDPKYEPVISKLLSGYYDQDRKSEKIEWSLETKLRQLEAVGNITNAVFYLKLLCIYVFLYGAAAIYLRVFEIRSFLALTARDIKHLERQKQYKSIAVQFLYGVVASILATLIYEYALKVVLTDSRIISMDLNVNPTPTPDKP